ncbi:MAG TPA: glycosyltransferase family 4 protein [Elusimicrobiota bacterium]|nr:glycosyltransferase family 4 protein [Elusimicrobiota bacterium]
MLYVGPGDTPHDRRFLARFAEAGLTVHALALRSRGGASLPPAGVRPVAWPLDRGGPGGEISPGPAAVGAFKTVVSEVRPDLVYAGPIPTAGFLAAESGFRPLALMSWGSDVLWDVDHDPRARERAVRALSRADLVQVDCDAVESKIRTLAPDSAARFVQFPWGVELDRFVPRPTEGPSRKEFVLISTRAWDDIYGIDTLLEGFRRASVDLPNLRLILLGGGPRADAVEAFIEKSKLTSVVKRPGRVKEYDLVGFFQSADAYLSASRSDGSSISLLQAMACGLPAIVSDIPANREWVEPGKNGWRFPVDDPAALARSVVSAWKAGARTRRAFGTVSRTRAVAKADWKANFERLLGAFHRLETH